ncbi:MAG: adenylate/guanylate cyclase domain-containing protein, partial [Alphaproteobacteria bacterium]
HVRVRVGLHFGPVVLGDIGGESRLEFAVVGDTVNVASRLVDLARDIGVQVVASDAVIAAAKGEDGATPAETGAFAEGPAQPIRGRSENIAIWTCGAA